MTPVEVRHQLVQTLGIDLVGPDCGSELLNEILPQAPSRWYLTGFLVPIDADEEQLTGRLSGLWRQQSEHQTWVAGHPEASTG